ncbi:helix-turn-helix domain-containing protein [Dyadobacter jiangsuensis]
MTKTITLDEPAFYELLNVVGEYMEKKFPATRERWVNDKEAMALLNVRSKTTLQSIRDQGLIRFSQPVRKIILYDRTSILEYIELHAKDAYKRHS